MERESEAEQCRVQATRELLRQNLPAAQGYVDRGLFLHRSGPLLQIAALVALARRQFPAALELWHEWREVQGGG